MPLPQFKTNHFAHGVSAFDAAFFFIFQPYLRFSSALFPSPLFLIPLPNSLRIFHCCTHPCFSPSPTENYFSLFFIQLRDDDLSKVKTIVVFVVVVLSI